MAVQFHGGAPLLWQTRALTGSSSFQSVAAVPFRRLETVSRCVESLPTFKLQCSPLCVRCGVVSKGSEVEISSASTYDEEETEPPPLVASLAIPGLPPCQESPHAGEAEAYLRERFPFNWSELEPIYHASISFMSFCHPATVSHERLAAISALCVHAIILDDVLLDSQDPILAEKMGIDPTIIGKPESIRECFHSLNVLLHQEEPPRNPTPIQEMTWKLGCDLRALSNPEWFTVFADAYQAFSLACLDHYKACLEGDSSRSAITDVESFTEMRIPTSGGGWNNLVVELCSNLFLPTEIRQHPTVEKLSKAAWIWGTYTNDIFSYAKEQDEPFAPNLIKALMDIDEGLPVVQAGWRAVNLTNSCAQEILDLETQLLAWDQDAPGSAALRRYVDGTKEAMTGNLYWHSVQKRYRHPNAPFPELRDLDIGFFPKAVHYKAQRAPQ